VQLADAWHVGLQPGLLQQQPVAGVRGVDCDGAIRDRVCDRYGGAVLLAPTGDRAVIREDELSRAAAARAGAGIQIGIRPGTIGGYAILAVLCLVYLIPLLFVLFVSLMSSRQFALNAASFPNPIMWSNYPEAWVKGAFNTYFVNTLIYTSA